MHFFLVLIYRGYFDQQEQGLGVRLWSWFKENNTDIEGCLHTNVYNKKTQLPFLQFTQFI